MAIPFTEGSGAGIMDDLVDDRHELRERADGPTFPTPQLHFVTVTYTATSCDEMDMIRTSIITDCTPIAPGPTPDPREPSPLLYFDRFIRSDHEYSIVPK